MGGSLRVCFGVDDQSRNLNALMIRIGFLGLFYSITIIVIVVVIITITIIIRSPNNIGNYLGFYVRV